MHHLGGTVSSCPLMQLEKHNTMQCFCTSDLLLTEHSVLSIPLKHRGGPGHGPCLEAGFTYWVSPEDSHQHIFSASHPLKRNLAAHKLCPQRRGCPGAPCNVVCISRACLLMSLSTEVEENELCLKVKLLVCFASEELSKCGHAGSSPWELGCKSLGWIVTNSRSWRFPGV